MDQFELIALPATGSGKSDFLRIESAASIGHPMDMKNAVHQLFVALLASAIFLAAGLFAQERQIRQPEEDGSYGLKFFDQLRTIFGQFRNSDLQRVFADAKPIDCSELVGRKGEWRQVAFFNEDRTLGDWFRERLEEVKADLAVYTFKGTCRDNKSEVQVATEFPTIAGVEAYNQHRIDLDQVDIMVNDPVTAVMNPATMAYTFDLPYLFLREESPRKIYSLVAPDQNAAYAPNVASRLECKAVSSRDVTYRFLICRVATVPKSKPRKNETWEPTFGSSAFFILSDGTETHTKVNLTFGDPNKPEEKSEEPAPAPAPANPPRPVLKRE
jgi:hypothetical protein